MKKILFFTLLAFATSVPCSLIAADKVMPETVAENLNGDEIRMPAELPGEHTLLLMAFQREQQKNIDGWVAGMALRGSNISWLELPVIENPGLLMRWFINWGMRRGIPGDDDRAHVASLYLDKTAFLSGFGISDETAVYAAVVDQSGEVLTLVKGDYTPDAAKKIWQALAK